MTGRERRHAPAVPGWVTTLAGLDRRWNGGNMGLRDLLGRWKPTGRARVEGRHRPEAVEARLLREQAETQVIGRAVDRPEHAYAESPS